MKPIIMMVIENAKTGERYATFLRKAGTDKPLEFSSDAQALRYGKRLQDKGLAVDFWIE